jgi:hypothetical protein
VANPAVTTQEMLASTARLTDQRAAGRHVLAIMSLPRPPPIGAKKFVSSSGTHVFSWAARADVG